jgi:hypothetical protein
MSAREDKRTDKVTVENPHPPVSGPSRRVTRRRRETRVVRPKTTPQTTEKRLLSVKRLYDNTPLEYEEVVEALIEFDGNLSAVSDALDCSRGKVSRFLVDHPELEDVMQDARESVLDSAERVLVKKARKGHTRELLFLLRTQGRRRGYGDTQVQVNIDVSQLSIEELEAIVNAKGRPRTVSPALMDGIRKSTGFRD